MVWLLGKDRHMKHARHLSRNKKLRKFFHAYLYIILFLMVVLGILLYKTRIFPQAPTSQFQNIPTTSTDRLQSSVSLATVTPSLTQQTSARIFILRNFSKNDIFFEKEKYPNVLTSLEDQNLIRFSCSDQYFLQNNEYESYDEVSKIRKTLQDEKLRSYVQKITEKYSNPVYTVKHFFPSIQYCDVENGPSLFFYRLGPCGGGCGGIQHIALMSKAGEIQFDNEVTPNVEGVPYFGCTLLAIVKQSVYLLCKGEGYASVENIDLTTNVYESIKSCRSEIMEPNAPYQCWEK